MQSFREITKTDCKILYDELDISHADLHVVGCEKSLGALFFNITHPPKDQFFYDYRYAFLWWVSIVYDLDPKFDFCCGPHLFWDACNEIQILGPQIIHYNKHLWMWLTTFCDPNGAGISANTKLTN